MSCPYRLLAVDLDGTLLDSKDQLPEANRAALHRAHQAGLVVCLTTGRCFSETRQVLEAVGLDLDVVVTAFGAIVSEARNGRTLYAQPLRPESLDRVCEFLAQRRCSFLLLHDGAEAAVDYSVLRLPRWCPGYDRWFEMVPCRLRDIEHWGGLAEPTYRVTLIEKPEFFRTIEPELAQVLPDSLVKSNAIYVPPYDVHVLEFFAPQVNKWFALQHLCRQQGIEPQEVVAVGDAINDLEMIRGAGLSFAMGNADERIKRLATRVTSTNDQAGVAQAINEIL